MKVLVKAGPGWRSTARRMERMFRRVLREELLPHSAPVVQLHVPPVKSHDELTAALRRVAVMPAGKQKAAITTRIREDFLPLLRAAFPGRPITVHFQEHSR